MYWPTRTVPAVPTASRNQLAIRYYVAKYAISKSNQLDKRVGSYNSFLWQINEIRALYKNLENADIYKMNISIVLMLDCLCLRLRL
jgi:hypothetical protein